MRLVHITTPDQLKSGEEFTLTVEHTPDCEAQLVSITVGPSGTFKVMPSGAALAAGGSTSVKCKVVRREAVPTNCLIHVTLHDSEGFASPEVV